MQRNHIFVHKSECLYKETQNLLKISDKTDGNFVQLHKHTQGTEQCICLKKALQTSQGAPACACPTGHVIKDPKDLRDLFPALSGF